MNIKNKKMKLRVGVLGATGMVGQRFIESLEEHPWFEIEMLAASEKSKGKMYKEVAKWYLSGEMPRDIAEMEVSGMDEEGRDEIFSSCDLDLAFSAIPSDIALEVEAAFAHNQRHIPSYSSSDVCRASVMGCCTGIPIGKLARWLGLSCSFSSSLSDTDPQRRAYDA